MAENDNDILGREIAEQTAASLSAILTKSTETILEKRQSNRDWLLSSAIVVLLCAVLFLFYLVWSSRREMQEALKGHIDQPGHHISYSGVVANDKRLDRVEVQLDSVARIEEKAEKNEQQVENILKDLNEIKRKMVK